MRYTTGELEIDADTFSVRCRGIDLKVEPRVLDFLLHLIRNRQRLVPKSELVNRVWHGHAVGDAAIARCASEARRILRDRTAIRTVHTRGYQWVAPVKTVDGDAT